MATRLEEHHESRKRRSSVNGPRTEIVYHGYTDEAPDDDQTMLDYALANTPTTWASLPRQDVTVDPVGPGKWIVTVEYAPSTAQNSSPPVPAPVVGDSSYAFDTTGGMKHIVRALSTVSTAYDPALIGVVSDWGTLIGVRDEGVDGLDIHMPQFTYEVTKQVSVDDIDALVDTIFDLTATVNNGPWGPFAAGEGLFLGARGSRRSINEDFWTVNFVFAGSKNATGLVVGAITDIDKEGWQYLDVEYATLEDATANVLVKKVIAVRVQKVYEYSDFDLLEAT